jgi:hypothetical protein
VADQQDSMISPGRPFKKKVLAHLAMLVCKTAAALQDFSTGFDLL